MNRSAARLVSRALGVEISTALLSALLLIASVYTASACVGDCDGSGDVAVNEIIVLVNMDLGSQTQLSTCPHGIPPSITDASQVDVTVIIQAVNNDLNGCPELSGTITYSGTRVVVSDSQPLIIFLAAADPNVDVVDIAEVPLSGGAFVLHAPAPGDYYLLYSVDVHDYGDALSVGAPFEVYNNRFAFSYPAPFPADPVSVPQAGLNLEFGDTALISGIAGTTTYTGQFPQGDIPPCICVQAFTDPLHTQADADYWCCGNQTRGTDGRTGRYELNHLQNPGTPYYLRVFVDLNDNRQLDPGELVGTCSNAVLAGPDQTDVSITFGDAGAATCIVPAAPRSISP